MRYLVRLTIVIASLLISISFNHVGAEIVIIVNAKSDLQQLTRRQAIDIYTGRIIAAKNGGALLPLDHAMNSMMREQFYTQLLGKSVATVNAYWARLLFTGRAMPPKELSDSNSVLKIIEKNINTIGYIRKEDVSKKVKIVYKLQDHAQ